MSYAGSSNRKALHDIRSEEKENLAIHREGGHQASLLDAILPRQQPSFFKSRPVK
jgi:hypothetical protein